MKPVNTVSKNDGDALIQDLRNTLVRRLTNGLANDAITTLTVGQLREVVRQEVGAALAEVAGNRPDVGQTAEDGGRASAGLDESQSGAFRLGPFLLIGIVLALGFAFVRSVVISAPSGSDNQRPAGIAPAPARANLPRLDSIASDGGVRWLRPILRGDESGNDNSPRLRSGNGAEI